MPYSRKSRTRRNRVQRRATRRKYTARGGFDAETVRGWVKNGNTFKLKAFFATQCVTGICSRFNINKKYDDDKTLLIYAIESGNDDIIKMLLENGADKKLPSESYMDRIRKFVRGGDIDVVKRLFKNITGINVNHKYDDNRDKTLLMYAIEGRHDDILELLLNHGAKVTGKDTDNFTPFHYAIYKGTLKSVKLLLKKEPQLAEAQFPSSGFYPLGAAAEKSDYDKVEILLKAGASKLIRDKLGMQAYQHATDDAIIRKLKPSDKNLAGVNMLGLKGKMFQSAYKVKYNK